MRCPLLHITREVLRGLDGANSEALGARLLLALCFHMRVLACPVLLERRIITPLYR